MRKIIIWIFGVFLLVMPLVNAFVINESFVNESTLNNFLTTGYVDLFDGKFHANWIYNWTNTEEDGSISDWDDSATGTLVTSPVKKGVYSIRADSGIYDNFVSAAATDLCGEWWYQDNGGNNEMHGFRDSGSTAHRIGRCSVGACGTSDSFWTYQDSASLQTSNIPMDTASGKWAKIRMCAGAGGGYILVWDSTQKGRHVANISNLYAINRYDLASTGAWGFYVDEPRVFRPSAGARNASTGSMSFVSLPQELGSQETSIKANWKTIVGSGVVVKVSLDNGTTWDTISASGDSVTPGGTSGHLVYNISVTDATTEIDWVSFERGVAQAVEQNCWSMDKTDMKDNEILKDLNNTNNMTIISSPLNESGTDCKIGGCIHFDGNSDYLKSQENAGITGASARSWTAWVKHDAAPATTQDLFVYGSEVDCGVNGLITLSSNVLYHFGFGPCDITFTGYKAPEEWTFFAVVYDGNTLTLFINGTNTSSGVVPLNSVNNKISVGLRQIGGSPTTYFDGRIDELKFWDGALTSAQITSEYNSGSGISCSGTTAPPPSTPSSKFPYSSPLGRSGNETFDSNAVMSVNWSTASTSNGVASITNGLSSATHKYHYQVAEATGATLHYPVSQFFKFRVRNSTANCNLIGWMSTNDTTGGGISWYESGGNFILYDDERGNFDIIDGLKADSTWQDVAVKAGLDGRINVSINGTKVASVEWRADGAPNAPPLFFALRRFKGADTSCGYELDNLVFVNGTNYPADQQLPPPPLDTTPPGITSYNMTSSGGCTNWNIDKNNPCTTSNTLPIVSFATNESAFCRIGVTNVNYTSMGVTRNCLGGEGTIQHACTLTQQDQLTQQSSFIYLSCKNANNNENPASTSGALALTITGLVADEPQGVAAIETGISNALVSGYTVHSNQKIYVRRLDGTQSYGTFDRVAKWNGKIWAFNYITGLDNLMGMLNMTPVLHVLELANLSTATITSNVQATITSTK